MPMDALQAVGVPELRDALRFVRAHRCSVSAEELATEQSVHHNVARRRLDRLAEAGLLVKRRERRTGRSGPGAGRPANVYCPAPETVEIEFPERPYHDLVGLLLDVLPDRARRQRLHEVGRSLADKLAAKAGLKRSRDLRRGLEGVCRAVGQLGYQAAVEEATADRAVITTPTCPLRPLVVARPELSEIDQGMWSGLIEAAVPGATAVGCETCDCLDPGVPCRVVVTLRRPDARPRGRGRASDDA